MTIGDLLRFRGDRASGADMYQALLGADVNALANMARAQYPEEGAGSAHHRLAAKIATQRLGGGLVGLVLPQLGGLAVEGLEAMGGGMKNRNWLEDTGRDIRANWRGSVDAIGEQAAALQQALLERQNAMRGMTVSQLMGAR